MEATCVHMFLRGDAKRVRDDFVDVALSEYGWRFASGNLPIITVFLLR
jgi:hypothetical protein